MDDRLIEQLEAGLKQPLPGQEVQYQMAHVVRRRVEPPPTYAKQAAVLALFYPLKERWHLVFIERQASHADDRHAGQISFPGGRQEPSDASLQETALREAEEEVGLDISQVNVLGRLTHLYIPVSNYLVNPFVGMTRRTPRSSPPKKRRFAISCKYRCSSLHIPRRSNIQICSFRKTLPLGMYLISTSMAKCFGGQQR